MNDIFFIYKLLNKIIYNKKEFMILYHDVYAII